ncbi:MAG TPA: lytic murein transglycosylase [Vicinamibacterales bacterium]|nr:lytic murein transglycosylase [Vicinamibacterales bacterium]
MQRRRALFGVVGVLIAGAMTVPGRASAQAPPPVAAVAAPPPFDDWLAELRTEALTRGIREEIFDRAFHGLREPSVRILERDRAQAEFTLDLDAYLKRRLTRDAVRTAQRMYTRHRTLLQRVAKRYGVDPATVVAVWGLESNFGRFSGVRPTVTALATLAYDPRRSTFFREELFTALEIVNRGDIELERLRGSWAGALGQPQFMPSSYLKYAQDFDEDGRRDIWSSLPDVFASIAYYLQEHGWSREHRWGREVRLPASREPIEALPLRSEGCRARRLMTVPLPLDEWRRLGVRTATGGPLPRADIAASLVPAGSRFFLVYGNYEALLDYNCSHSYALSIALLAERVR